jgi:hypothetical protein
MLSINPDAQSIPELDHMHWGVEMTRKGGVPADRVLNAMTLPEITRYLPPEAALVRPGGLMPQTRSPLISVAASASRLGIGSCCWKAKADAHAGPFVRHRYLAHPRLQALCLGP